MTGIGWLLRTRRKRPRRRRAAEKRVNSRRCICPLREHASGAISLMSQLGQQRSLWPRNPTSGLA